MKRLATWIIFLLLVHCTTASADLLQRIVEKRLSIEEEIEKPEISATEKARLLISVGRFREAEEILEPIRPETVPGQTALFLLRAAIDMARSDFSEAEADLIEAERIDPQSEEALRIRLEILRAREDLAAIDTLTTAWLRTNSRSSSALTGRGRLHLELHRYEEAKTELEEALALAVSPEEGVEALAGLMRIAYKRNSFDEAADLAEHVLDAGFPSGYYLSSTVQVLIRLGEVGKAIDLASETLRWNPLHEQAHYFLGNGYSRKNYTELETAYPSAFPDSTTRVLLGKIRDHLAVGDREKARQRLVAMKKAQPELADPNLYLGSLFWEEGEPDSALACFTASLLKCPEYGRAHNGFAKAMEWKRLRGNVYREKYEREFDALPFPEVEGIDRFVTNYSSLSERHRKRVALSVEPWARFLPVLIEVGAGFYVKPLYFKLSETPSQEVLRDLRISYDSRLWDDVRGCGGFHTVTGIEDIERSIFNKYNTVLHELTHQVHYILTPDEKRRIQEAYRSAKEREKSGGRAFVTRYQASSVWEYFAEGMNSLHSPRHDPYDTREILRERLESFDPDLIALIEEISADGPTDKYYAPALVVSAYERVENGRCKEAIELLERALERTPRDESALCAVAYTHSLMGDAEEAVGAALRATQAHGSAAEPWLEHARAIFLQTGSRSEEIAVLLRAREEVNRAERYRIELALGGAYVGRGDLRKAKDAYQWVLEYQTDNPDALWGLGHAHGLAGDKEEADRYFEQALRRRSGIVELRADYSRCLARQERFDEAAAQIEEARLLDPTNTDAEASAGLLAIFRGDWTEAKRTLEDAIAFGSYNDMAAILLAHTWVAEGEVEKADSILTPLLLDVERSVPPCYIYLENRGSYRSVHEYPAEERWLLYQTASELASVRGDSVSAEQYRHRMEQVFR